MSVKARLKEIEALVCVPLLNIQDELDSGLRALAGLRNLLAGQSSPECDGLYELVTMTEERFLRADGLLKGFAYQTLGPRPGMTAP